MYLNREFYQNICNWGRWWALILISRLAVSGRCRRQKSDGQWRARRLELRANMLTRLFTQYGATLSSKNNSSRAQLLSHGLHIWYDDRWGYEGYVEIFHKKEHFFGNALFVPNASIMTFRYLINYIVLFPPREAEEKQTETPSDDSPAFLSSLIVPSCFLWLNFKTQGRACASHPRNSAPSKGNSGWKRHFFISLKSYVHREINSYFFLVCMGNEIKTEIDIQKLIF